MSKYLGDYVANGEVNFKWPTNDGNGKSINPATPGTISVYKADNTTETVTGVTDTRAFDGHVGLHHCNIDLSDAFYATGNDYQVVLDGAIIDGQDPVNTVLAEFSIQNRFMRGTDLAALASALATHEANLVTHNNNLGIVDGKVDAIPTAVENRTEMDSNSTKLANLDQSLSTTESNIRGGDGDDLKTISDQIDGIGGGGIVANPAIIACAKDAWTKIATNVTGGLVHNKGSQATYFQTYRLTGQAAPTNLTDAVPLFATSHTETISSSAAIDVYVFCKRAAGSVRVDL